MKATSRGIKKWLASYHINSRLPLLPSGPGGVCGVFIVRNQPMTYIQEYQKSARKMMLSTHLKIERIPRQRGIKLLIMPNSTVILQCSKNERESEIKKFLLSHKNWIEKSLRKFKKIQEEYPQITFFEGQAFPFLGQNYCLQIRRGEAFNIQMTSKFTIQITTTKELSHREIRKILLDFYYRLAQKIIIGRVSKLSQEMSLIPQKISLRKQKTLWGSCTQKGHIQINWKLMAAPLSVLDYVITHELAHLKHHNHSKQFWDEVSKFCPEYKLMRRWLRKEHYSFDFFNDYPELYSHRIHTRY